MTSRIAIDPQIQVVLELTYFDYTVQVSTLIK